jgi:hypothetical protein
MSTPKSNGPASAKGQPAKSHTKLNAPDFIASDFHDVGGGYSLAFKAPLDKLATGLFAMEFVWSPAVPKDFSKVSRQKYLAARDAFVAAVSKQTGTSIQIVNL